MISSVEQIKLGQRTNNNNSLTMINPFATESDECSLQELLIKVKEQFGCYVKTENS